MRVFIVEDHTMVRKLLARLVKQTPELTLNGSAASAEEALEQISESRPDLVLVDVSLPGMDGIQFIRLLHERSPEILTLAVSGHDEALYAAAALRAGARGYVMKGRVQQIVEAIRQVCNGNRYVSEQLRDQLGDID